LAELPIVAERFCHYTPKKPESTAAMPINVSIVEDQEGTREHLTLLVNGAPGFSCVSSHGSAEEAIKDLPAHEPDVVLMDINLPVMSGIECVSKLKEIMPELQVLMWTMYEDADQIFEALTAGANGYLLKRDPPSKVLDSINELVKDGGAPFSPRIARIVVQYFQEKPPATSEKFNLSKRELEILELLAKGFRYKEIASDLGISFDTVRSHLRNIYEKLQVSSRTEAVVKFLNGQR
jgi:DNA-binding NarL/FixJ family response regulator